MIHYFDNAATTPVRPEAVQAAVEAMTEGWGNPSSRYALGREAADRVAGWRRDVAAGLGCRPEEVFFTSCGSEGDNWAIRGAVELGRRRGRHIITTAIEHAAVLEPCRELERQGYEVTYLRPDREGNIALEELEAALRPDTVLVSMMLVNNELGSIYPIADIAKGLKAVNEKTLLHTDAVQGFLKVPCSAKTLGADFLTISAHKIGGPKGIGALYLSDRLVQAWFSLMGRSQRRKKPTQERFEPLVTAPFVSVASRVAHMLRGMLKGTLCRMGQLFSPQESRSTNVATFLALLELIRAGRVRLDETGTLTMDRARRPRNKQNQPTGKEAAADADHTAQ